MKRFVVATIGVLIVISLVVAGCGEQESAVTPGEGEELVSSCVSCHSDKDLLKEVASPEPEEEKSEATSGEG